MSAWLVVIILIFPGGDLPERPHPTFEPIPHSHGLTRSYSTSTSRVDGDPSDLSEQAHNEEPVEGSVWSVALSVTVTKRFHTGEYELTSRCTPTGCARSTCPIGARLLVDVLLALRPLPRASAITSSQRRRESSLDSLAINHILRFVRHNNPPFNCFPIPYPTRATDRPFHTNDPDTSSVRLMIPLVGCTLISCVISQPNPVIPLPPIP